MVGTSLWDYIFIRTCIFVLHLIAPVSLVYSVTSQFIHLPWQPPRIVQAWLGLEAIFYLFIYLPRRQYLQRAANHPSPPCREERRELFWRCHSNITDPDRYLRKWFRDAPAAEIKRDNVKDFFRWAFLNAAESNAEDDDELEEYTREMEKLLGRRLEPGRGDAKCIRLSLDEVEMLHRSLWWYLCIFVVDIIACAYMWYHSFSFHRTSVLQTLSIFPLRLYTLLTPYRSPAETVTYWHRPHTSKTRLPIVFIHGIGVGLYPYINFLADLTANDGKEAGDGQVGIIAIEILSISSRITSETLLKDEMCAEISRILAAHGWETFSLVSHSYGSVVAAHLLRTPQIAQRIGSVVFVDPVSFLLHHPDVAYNFICRKPTSANEYLLSYFGSADMGVSHTLFRRFFWADNILWKEHVQGHRVTVVLAGKDIVIDTKAVRAYLTDSPERGSKPADSKDDVCEDDGLEILWFQELDHGQVFDTKATRRRLVEAVRRSGAKL